MFHFPRWTGLTLAALLLAGCGAGTNFNQIWGGDDDAFDSLMARARISYDRGDFKDASELAEKARAINPLSEDANILLGYINLSLGGIDPFILAQRLIEVNTPESAATNLAEGSNSGGVAGTLQNLNKLINLTSDDLTLLSESYETPASSFFAEIPILRPKTVTAELRETVPVLKAMNNALKYVCGFVEDGVRVAADPRDSFESCPKVAGEKSQTYKAHFLWAFAHLTEALVFQSVLLYSDGKDGKNSNIEQRSKKINNADFSATGTAGLTTFVTTVAELKESVDAIFASETTVAGGVTQLTATLNAMQSVSLAFAALPGMPSDLTSKITTAMDEIKKIGQKINTSSETLGQSQALKGQMTETFSKTVATKIDETICKEYTSCNAVPEEVKNSEDVKKLCDSYTSLATGVDPAKQAPPQVCQ